MHVTPWLSNAENLKNYCVSSADKRQRYNIYLSKSATSITDEEDGGACSDGQKGKANNNMIKEETMTTKESFLLLSSYYLLSSCCTGFLHLSWQLRKRMTAPARTVDGDRLAISCRIVEKPFILVNYASIVHLASNRKFR